MDLSHHLAQLPLFTTEGTLAQCGGDRGHTELTSLKVKPHHVCGTT